MVAGYRLDALLGSGGMSVVYLAEHVRLRRKVALKLLAHALAEDVSFRERFERESRRAAELDHPNVVPVYDAGEADGELYIAMKYVAGSDLKSLIRRDGPLELARTLSILEQAARGLDAAHERRLVHRDVKPANILVDERPVRAYISDFGIVKHTESNLTRTGFFMGTADYAAPEQIEGRQVDARTDVYALGCVLYECLAGRKPFARELDVAVMHAHLEEPPPRLSSARPDLGPALDEVIATAMAKSKDERYPSCAELVAAARAAAAPTTAAPTTAAPSVAREVMPAPAGKRAKVESSVGRRAAPLRHAVARSWRRRRRVAAVAALLAAVAAGVTAFALTRGESAGTSSRLAALMPSELWRDCAPTRAALTAAVASARCVPRSSAAAPHPDRWEVSLFRDDAALEEAYSSMKAELGVRTDRGSCDATGWAGEGTWDHTPRDAAGRHLCRFDGNSAFLAWTHEARGQADHQPLLAVARAEERDHRALLAWWRAWRNGIGTTGT